MNSGVVSELRSKFENSLMYVINQKSSHFPNNHPNGPIYFADSQVHPGMHMHGDQLPFSPGIPPSMINNGNLMPTSMTRFNNPHNGNSIRHHPIRTSAMIPHGTKNQKSALNISHISDDINMPFPVSDNFSNVNNSYKSRIPSLESGLSIVNSQNNPNLLTNLNKPLNISTDPTMSTQSTTSSRVPTSRNKRSRPMTSRSHTPNVKESIYNQIAMAPIHSTTVVRPTSTNINSIPCVNNAIPNQKGLPSAAQNSSIIMPYNNVDMMTQQLRPRIQNNAINSYGCNRPQIMEKNMPIYPAGPLSSPVFSPATSVPSFFPQMENGFPLPMFHLHSKVSKLPECDRLTFPVNHGNLWGPLTLRHGDHVTEVHFELNQDNLQQIINRSDLDIVVTSFTHRDQFRLCHWPEFLELKINGNLLTLDNTVIQDLKAHMSCCIKKYCKLGTNTLQITVSKCVCCHLFQTYMVHRPTLPNAISTIQNKCTTSLSTKKLLSDIYSRSHQNLTGHPDETNNICVISLICPMSQLRITIPARTKSCKHIQPFDLLEFLRVQSKWPQYFCPICRVRITFNLNEYIQNIVVDEVIKEILSQTDSTVRRVILYPDCKWKPVADLKSDGVQNSTVQSMQDPYEYDSSMQIIRQSPLSTKSSIPSPQTMIQFKPNQCSDMNLDKKTGTIHQYADPDLYCTNVNNNINNVCSSMLQSPTLSRNPYGDLQSRTNTPGLEPSPQKKTRKSPSHHHLNEGFASVSSLKMSDAHSRLAQQTDLVHLNSPDTMKTPLSFISVSPRINKTVSQSQSNNVHSIIEPNNKSTPTTTLSTNPMTLYCQNSSQNNQEPDTDIISSTTSFSNNISIRPSTSPNIDNVNKQTSSGSSNPSSPPEFFDPHSSTTNYEDDENSSLHLQRLIGFIDEILSEEEEYVLDTQWASFTWPSADKSLDLLHLSDIEKLL